MVLVFIFRVRLLQEKTTVVNDLCRLYAAVPSSNSTWAAGPRRAEQRQTLPAMRYVKVCICISPYTALVSST